MKNKVNSFISFINYSIWYCDTATMPWWKKYLIYALKAVILLVRNFNSSKSHLWASALTYYSILSIVPILAIGFAIAHGFGLGQEMATYLEQQINNPTVTKYIFEFSRNALKDTKVGIITGVGVFVLLFSVIKMICDIEKAFNFIWGVQTNRPLLVKASYYLSVLIICPILLITAGSATAFVNKTIAAFAAEYSLYPVSTVAIKLMPFLIVWLLFTIIYKLMPNTRVNLKAAFAGALVAGTLYQFLQIGFFAAQVALSKYNAIYGSLSALPLFMIYLHISWLIVLFGTQVSFLTQNIDNIDVMPGGTRLSGKFKYRYSIAIAAIITRKYVEEQKPPCARDIATILGLPKRVVSQILHSLCECRVIVPVYSGKRNQHCAYLPMIPPEKMTAAELIRHAAGYGHGEPPEKESELIREINSIIEQEFQIIADSPANVKLTDLPQK